LLWAETPPASEARHSLLAGRVLNARIAKKREKGSPVRWIRRYGGLNVTALPHLTDQDLKDIGVLLGHRRIMLAAIARLNDTPVAAASVAVAVSGAQPLAAATSPPTPAVPVGERRHVVVMFCDLVDSTGIAAQLDAEEWRDGGYLGAASAAVAEMGGKVAKKLGDGLMAIFGYPMAQENDAERAVRASLAIQRALADLNRKNEGTGKPVLAARIAIESGPVVVDATGEIFGDVPNVAGAATGADLPVGLPGTPSARCACKHCFFRRTATPRLY
jgi:class 3 adenylate cyclase